MSCMGHNFFTICIWQNAKFRLMQTGGVHGGVNRVGEGADYGEWDPTATVQMVARELARYLSAKKFVFVSKERSMFIASIPQWSRFFDPLLGTSDGRKIVLRNSWIEIIVVEIDPITERWATRHSSIDECQGFDQIKHFLSDSYETYASLHPTKEYPPASKSEYMRAWLSVGITQTREWQPWMLVAGSGIEAHLWNDNGVSPGRVVGWKRANCRPHESLLWMNIGADHLMALNWFQNGWTTEYAMLEIERLSKLEAEKLRLVSEFNENIMRLQQLIESFDQLQSSELVIEMKSLAESLNLIRSSSNESYEFSIYPPEQINSLDLLSINKMISFLTTTASLRDTKFEKKRKDGTIIGVLRRALELLGT